MSRMRALSSGRRLLAWSAAVLLVAGCAAPAGHYYSLRSAGMSPAAGQAAASFAIQVQPVSVPKALDRPQIVVRLAEGVAEVSPLTGYLWAAPLSDELRLALSEALSARLGVLDLPRQQAPAGLPVWQVSAQVLRLDAVYDRHVELEAAWRLALDGADGRVLACRMQWQRPAGEGVGALVSAWRDAWQAVASVIAEQLAAPTQALAPRPGVVCAGGGVRQSGG